MTLQYSVRRVDAHFCFTVPSRKYSAISTLMVDPHFFFLAVLVCVLALSVLVWVC